MRTAVGVIAWQDGNTAIQRTVRSAESFADEIIIAEGPISAYPEPLPLTTPNKTDFKNNVFLHSQRTWKTQAEKRDFCLRYARLFKCDWLLFLDTDEYLENPDALWEWLLFHYKDEIAVPIPWLNKENNDVVIPAPWKLLNVNQCKQIISRSYIVTSFSGQTLNLVSDSQRAISLNEEWPFIVHDPSIRPEWRKPFRLGPVEDQMEPMPEKVSEFHCPPLPSIKHGVAR